jgi:hypothetical protein
VFLISAGSLTVPTVPTEDSCDLPRRAGLARRISDTAYIAELSLPKHGGR